MSPVVPHLANECLVNFGFKKELDWPSIKEKYLVKNENLIVIQINGKKRNTISVDKSLNEKELVDLIKNQQLVAKYFDNGELVKTIYIKDKLINFIIK